eukprot:CAMPEP_0198229314 /NCGR_PEP_ID=MMETSP1445-20131203/114061_1 /TAXON_ID=36898 /ORGANISM="Pyramimonas sp., Strain CCMP2087" /LENGTH=130 /DNA_ID=CAMNT_0043909769 /DNA_START=170 /DNA_END=559 /DNA_ORIENTATION=+
MGVKPHLNVQASTATPILRMFHSFTSHWWIQQHIGGSSIDDHDEHKPVWPSGLWATSQAGELYSHQSHTILHRSRVTEGEEEGEPKWSSTVLVTALGSWGNLVPHSNTSVDPATHRWISITSVDPASHRW